MINNRTRVMRTTAEIHKARQKVAAMIETPKYNYGLRRRTLHIKMLGRLNEEYNEAAEVELKQARGEL